MLEATGQVRYPAVGHVDSAPSFENILDNFLMSMEAALWLASYESCDLIGLCTWVCYTKEPTSP